MKQLNSILLICIITLVSYGQGVQIIYQNKTHKPKEKIESFYHIDKQMDLSASALVGKLKGYSTSSGNQTYVELFNDFWKNANKIGANAFIIDSVENKSEKLVYITVAVYYLTAAEIDKNYQYYAKNMVYVFGDLHKNGTIKNFKFNDVKMSVAPFEYIAYQNKVGEEAIISIGGITGAKTWIKGKEGRLPEHLSLSSFGVGPSYYPGPGMGVTFNTGRIYPVELCFGQFLLELLKEKKQ